jgi:hypothetical protein
MFEDLVNKSCENATPEEIIKALEYNLEQKQKLIDQLIIESLEKQIYIIELEKLLKELEDL